MPECVSRIFSKKAPNPFHRQGNIQNFGIGYTQTALVFWLTDFSPVNPMLLVFFSYSLPEKPASVFIKTCMSPIRQQEEAHGVQR
jgi:hypothetical protein